MFEMKEEIRMKNEETSRKLLRFPSAFGILPFVF